MKSMLFVVFIILTMVGLVAVNIAADMNEIGMCAIFMMAVTFCAAGIVKTAPRNIREWAEDFCNE